MKDLRKEILQENIAMMIGSILAIMAAKLAATHCIAVKLRAVQTVFWHKPILKMVYHSRRLKSIFWPNQNAIVMANSPEIKNLKDKIKNGGALIINILAAVKALAHMIATLIPIRMDLISKIC